ncbi:MAG: ABC transporter permease [Myxococcota bacterium]|nr:ABC transporter permease [Myxococcota bacterium]
MDSVKAFFKYRHLVVYLVTLDLRLRYRGSFLGFTWTLLNPVLLMLVLWAVFSRFGRIQEENYALFLLSGLMSWLFFEQSVTRGQNCIISNKALLQKIYIPKLVFPFSIFISNLINLLFFLVAYFVIAIVTGWGVSFYYLLAPFALGILFILSSGAGLLMCSANVFFRDFTHLSSVLLRALFYLSPILYNPSMFSERVQYYLKLNPAYYPIISLRQLIYNAECPTIETWLTGLILSLCIFALGFTVFMMTEKKFLYYA